MTLIYCSTIIPNVLSTSGHAGFLVSTVITEPFFLLLNFNKETPKIKRAKGTTGVPSVRSCALGSGCLIRLTSLNSQAGHVAMFGALYYMPHLGFKELRGLRGFGGF